MVRVLKSLLPNFICLTKMQFLETLATNWLNTSPTEKMVCPCDVFVTFQIAKSENHFSSTLIIFTHKTKQVTTRCKQRAHLLKSYSSTFVGYYPTLAALLTLDRLPLMFYDKKLSKKALNKVKKRWQNLALFLKQSHPQMRVYCILYQWGIILVLGAKVLDVKRAWDRPFYQKCPLLAPWHK